MLLRPPLFVVHVGGCAMGGNASMIDVDRYVRLLDLVHNRVKVTNDALNRDFCSLRLVRGTGNVLAFDGVEFARFASFDCGQTADALRVMRGVADLSWALSRSGLVVM